MRTIAIWLALGALMAPDPGTAFALDTPDELTAAEWKCERTAAETLADHVAGAADCLAACRREAVDDPSRFCSRSNPDPETRLCLERLRTRAEIQFLRKCSASDCPDCYLGGDCRSFSGAERSDSEIFASSLVLRLLCDDRNSVDGLNDDEADCQARILDASSKLIDDLRGCFKKCHQRRQKGVLAEEECLPSGSTGTVADSKTQKCIDKARRKFLGACPACFDPPECWGASFPPLSCASAIDSPSSWALQAARRHFCVDQPVCGDGRVSPSEECDPGSFEVTCGPNESCTASCECEPLPDRCAEAELLPGEGGVFEGFTSGPSTTSSFCGGQGPERVYVWIPDASGPVVLRTCNSSFDTVAYLRTDCRDPASEIACNDDFCGFGSTVHAEVQAGVPYYVFVDGFGSLSSGPFELQIMGTSE